MNGEIPLRSTKRWRCVAKSTRSVQKVRYKCQNSALRGIFTVFFGSWQCARWKLSAGSLRAPARVSHAQREARLFFWGAPPLQASRDLASGVARGSRNSFLLKNCPPQAPNFFGCFFAKKVKKNVKIFLRFPPKELFFKKKWPAASAEIFAQINDTLSAFPALYLFVDVVVLYGGGV